MKLLDPVRGGVRRVMRGIAGALDTLTGGKLSPNAITLAGLLAHVPIAYLIATGHLVAAGCLLIVFSLFDSVDGELARLQHKASAVGMFLDSATDRMKEIVLYSGMVFFILASAHTRTAVFVLVGALGISLLTTYLNAWGEVVLAYFNRTKDHEINKTFRNGLLGFDARMFVLVVGLLSGKLVAALCVILVLGTVTVWQRFSNITRRLQDV